MPSSRPSRRSFLTASTALAAGWTIVPARVLGGPGKLAPSETPTRAVIGCGGMGTGHIKSINTECPLLAVCDVDDAHLAKGLQNAGPQAKGYKDWREILDRKDIDIVHIP